MPWTLAGVTIRPGDQGYGGSRRSFYAIQEVLDSTAEIISYFGAGSRRRSVRFVLFEDDNGGAGLAALETAVQNNTNAVLVADTGSQGNFRILEFSWERQQDFANTLPVYECRAELIAV